LLVNVEGGVVVAAAYGGAEEGDEGLATAVLDVLHEEGESSEAL
jgi:hypothetical protein